MNYADSMKLHDPETCNSCREYEEQEQMSEQREINSHSVGIDIAADALAEGGASHVYLLQYVQDSGGLATQVLSFQRGPVREVGVNGITHEALLAVLIDRLECFQAGEFKCVENEVAKQHLKLALDLLQRRTRDRVKREVEGTNGL